MTRHIPANTGRTAFASHRMSGLELSQVFQRFGQPWPEWRQVGARVATSLRVSRKGGWNHHKIRRRGQSPTPVRDRDYPCFKARRRYVRFDPNSPIESENHGEPEPDSMFRCRLVPLANEPVQLKFRIRQAVTLHGWPVASKSAQLLIQLETRLAWQREPL